MNVMVDKGLTATANQVFDAADSAPEQRNATLAKLMKAWESKQAGNARKAGGFGLMAVSLSACGSDSDDDDDGGVVDLGSIFNLTTGADNSADLEAAGDSDIAGNVFNAPLADASGSLQGILGIQTLGGQDVIVGTDEVDVLNAELNATGTTQNPTITDVEVINLTVMPLPALGAIVPSFGILDLHRSEGYEQLWNIDSRYSLQVINVSTNDEGDAPAIGMDGVLGGTTYTVAYDAGETVGEQNVIATGVGGLGLGSTNLSVTVPNGIDTLNLSVSDGVMLNLQGAAALMPNLVVAGDGDLTLTGSGNFAGLVTLDSAGYDEGLNIDVSGSEVLTDVGMGDGDDRVVVDQSVVRDTLSADMGEGQDTFAIVDADWDDLDSDEISALSFDVTGAQTLEFVDDVDLGGWSSGDATLDLEGFVDLETIVFRDFEAANNNFTLSNGPETLNIDVASDFDDVALLDTGNTVDLAITVTGDNFDDEIDIDNVTGGALETLTLVNLSDDGVNVPAGDIDLDITSDATTDVSSLQSISADGTGDVDIDLDASDVDADMDALTSVSMIAGEDADLVMNGVAPVQQEQTFTVAAAGLWSGEAVFIIPGVGEVSGDSNSFSGLAPLVADLNADLAGTNYEASLSGNTITFTKLDGGPADPILLDEVNSVGIGAFSVVSNGITEPGVDGDGFLGVEEVVVDAGADADVELTDVYGEFTLMVTAGDDAWVDLTNTNVVGDVSVVAVDHADVDVTGGFSGNDYFGNPNLTSLTIESATADVTLANDLGSFVTLDVSDVATNVVVDAGAAEYAEGSVVSYLIGATQDGTANTDVEITAEGDGDVREVFQFTGDDIGEIEISNFDDGDLAEGDRDIIDFSQFANVSDDSDLQFDATGDDIVITAASGQFEGSITLVELGATGTNSVDVNDLEQFNVNYV